MENVHFKKIILLLIIIILSCSKNEEIINQSPSEFEININGILSDSATISWSESIDPEGSQVFYDLYLDGEKLIDNTTQLNFDFSDLEEGKIYLGKIIASDPEGNETLIDFNFETSINQPPTSFNVTITSKAPLNSSLNWSESFDPEEGEIVYDVFLENELIVENINRLNYFLPHLKGLTSYTGYVEAKDIEGKKTRANFSFTTELKIYDGTLVLSNQDQVNDFGASGYNVIEGNLIIGSTSTNLTDISDLSSLSTIQKVEDDIYLQNTVCENFKGLSNITQLDTFSQINITNNIELLTLEGLEGISTAFRIYIASNPQLLNFKGLDNLKSVNQFSFPNNQSLVSIEDLSNLSIINDLDIGNNNALTNLKGLEGLKTIDELNISSNENLLNFEGLNNLESVNSFISIQANSSITNLIGFSKLKMVKSLSIIENNNLISLNGLETLNQVTLRVRIRNNQNLETLEGINNIVFEGSTFEYNLEIYGNGKITNLDALSNYRFIGAPGEYYVQLNPELVDCCGLIGLTQDLDIEQFNENTIFRWNKHNPTYEEMLNGICSPK